MDRLRFYLFAVLFGIASAAIFVAAALAEWVRPGSIYAFAPPWSQTFRFLSAEVLGIRMALSGAPPPGPAIVAAKHQSVWETLALLDLLRNPCVVLKAELLAVPFWRFFARAYGAVPIDRSASSAALRQMIAGARAAKDRGRLILVFPEGTRVAAGSAPPLESGISALYAMLRLPVAPLALDSGRVWPNDGTVPRPGVVHLRFQPVIAPGLARAPFEAALHVAMNAEPA